MPPSTHSRGETYRPPSKTSPVATLTGAVQGGTIGNQAVRIAYYVPRTNPGT